MGFVLTSQLNIPSSTPIIRFVIRRLYAPEAVLSITDSRSPLSTYGFLLSLIKYFMFDGGPLHVVLPDTTGGVRGHFNITVSPTYPYTVVFWLYTTT